MTLVRKSMHYGPDKSIQASFKLFKSVLSFLWSCRKFILEPLNRNLIIRFTSGWRQVICKYSLLSKFQENSHRNVLAGISWKKKKCQQIIFNERAATFHFYKIFSVKAYLLVSDNNNYHCGRQSASNSHKVSLKKILI